MHWDIFCQVIDNYGDAGVCWRLCADLASRGHKVRLWIDDASILQWLAPQPFPAHIEVVAWNDAITSAHEHLQKHVPDVLIEAFGCEIPQPYLLQLRQSWPQHHSSHQPHWLNLEYLSAEPYVEGMHQLHSPVMFGAAAGWNKKFFYPGFTPQTGGLLREPNLLSRQQTFNATAARKRWLEHAINASNKKDTHPQSIESQFTENSHWALLFSYESHAMQAWLEQLAKAPTPTVLMVAAGRSQKAFLQCYAQQNPSADLCALPLNSTDATIVQTVQWGNCLALLMNFMPQAQFDECLWTCDFNIVRGEDSFVRALWAGKPFIWHIYEQQDNAHQVKLEAFLDWAQAPETIRAAFLQWNNVNQSCSRPHSAVIPSPPLSHAPMWQEFAQKNRERLIMQEDLVTQLLQSTSVSA